MNDDVENFGIKDEALRKALIAKGVLTQADIQEPPEEIHPSVE